MNATSSRSLQRSDFHPRMRTAELAFIITVIIGCMFKFMHWPGANVLLVCGGGGLAFFYFPFGFRTLPAPKSMDQILWLTVLGGASLWVALVGEVAFLLRWPHQSKFQVIGAIGCAITVLVGMVLRHRHPRLDIYLDGLLIRCVVLGGLAVTLWALFSGKPR